MTFSQLCQLAGTWSGAIPASGMLAQEKRDGWRALYLYDHEGRPGLFTRNGMPIGGVGHILWHLGEIERAAGEPLMFDGEFQVDGTLAATKLWCESGWKAGGEAGQMFLFDALTRSEWERGGGDVPLIDRLGRLHRWMQAAKGDEWDWRPGSHGRDAELSPLVMLDTAWMLSPSEVAQAAQHIWARDGEGLVLKDPQSLYQRNRTSDWLKVKEGGAWMKQFPSLQVAA